MFLYSPYLFANGNSCLVCRSFFNKLTVLTLLTVNGHFKQFQWLLRCFWYPMTSVKSYLQSLWQTQRLHDVTIFTINPWNPEILFFAAVLFWELLEQFLKNLWFHTEMFYLTQLVMTAIIWMYSAYQENVSFPIF